MSFKNNVTRLLESKRIPYKIYTYDYDAGIHSAVDVAAAVGMPPAQVFKTLVVMPEGDKGVRKTKPLLVVIPGPDTLDLKSVAQAVGAKKARMASHDEAESLTGLQTGGISPLALISKGFDVYVDARAQNYETIAVSAGQRGAQVEVAVADLMTLTRARTIRLAD